MTPTDTSDNKPNELTNDFDIIMPTVRTMQFHDIIECLLQSVKDFHTAPLFGLFSVASLPQPE